VNDNPIASPAPPARAFGEEPFRHLVESVTDYGIFLLDTQGRIASWNRGAQALKGYLPHEIIGKHFSIFYEPEDIARNWPERELESARAVGRFEDEGWRRRKDGSRFWANIVITALRDESGVLTGYAKVTRDLTERRAHEEALRRSEERFRLLLEGVRDYAIMMLDQEGRVTSWNAGAERILGYSVDEVLGHSFQRFFMPEDITGGRPAEELRKAILNTRFEQHGWRVRKGGARFWAEVIVTPLHDADGQLRGFAKVTRDLSERKRIETLEEQGRHLTEFLAMLAHELRNPLAPIRNAIAIMGMAKELPKQVTWARDVIDRQTTQLARLVDDLLDVSRITRGKLRLREAPVDLNAAVTRAIEAAQPLIDTRRHRLHTTLVPAEITVYGDVARLTQVVLNLLNNAAKYTPEGGDIWLEVKPLDNSAEVRVRDNGVGIPATLIGSIFDLFAQGERTIDRSEGGLGIGLTLARRLVALHGGRIEARSEGGGMGAEFVVTLPRMGSEISAAAMPDEGFQMPLAAKKLAILVVDDNVDAAVSMAMLLRMAGHEVEIEHSGPPALARALAMPPDVMLLDIGLPGMSGYEVARQLRAHPIGKGPRIIAMTGYGQDEDRRRSLEAGFDGHLVKPVLPAELFALITQAADHPAG
jgi:PAS domain S-box-containing protein